MANELSAVPNRPLYDGTRFASFDRNRSNTGLWYDKFCDVWDRNWTIREGRKLDWIKTVCGPVGCESQLREHSERQRRLAEKLNGQALTLITATRFATGLGREHPIEIGFAWHHTLGTPYLPGSSVKGLLRAYVREWVSDQVADEVFGPAGNDNDRGVGKWIFFDAIPTGPAQLEADVMTPHYGPYYRGEAAPGDWHSPVPIPFLAVAREQSFQFAFAPRNLSNTGRLPGGKVITNDTIADWLRSALHWLGAGAKTNTGYGVFREAGHTPSDKPPATRLKFEATLELVTPAFLAGADQQDPTDCTLRPATLRGQLRWWWRTLHAGFVNVPTLRALEAAVWGDTTSAGAVRITLGNGQNLQRIPAPGKHTAKNKKDQDVLRLDPVFAREHKLDRAPEKRTQGFLYLSFGMDEMPAGRLIERKQRTCLLPGAVWEVTISARDRNYSRPGIHPNEKPRRIPAHLIRDQAKAALWLLCQFGGVGSKSRNGFGSLGLTLDQPPTLASVKQAALALRRAVGISDSDMLPNELSSLENMLLIDPIKTPWKNYWFVFDQLGFSIQDFCQADGHKRTWIKEGLGLPRKIGRSDNDGAKARGFSRTFDKQTQQEVVWLGQQHPHIGHRDPKDMRHTSPIHFHIHPDPDGTFSIRVVAFPSAILPDATTSKSLLASLLDHLKANLVFRINASPSGGAAVTTTPQQKPNQPTVRPASSVPEITIDQLKQRLATLPAKQVLLKVEIKGPESVQIQALRAANIPAGYQADGGWSLGDVPTLPTGITVVLAERPAPPSKRGKFIEVIGRLPQPSLSFGKGLTQNQKGPRR